MTVTAPINENQIANNLMVVWEKIEKAAFRAGRSMDDIHLVVVTKTHPVETVRAVVRAGVTDLGENYVEEAEGKISALSGTMGLRWHMIGHLQSRKASRVVKYFDHLHSLDSLKLARKLSQSSQEYERNLPVLMQFNLSGEETKEGWLAVDEHTWAELLPEVASVVALPNLEVSGLMTIPPFSQSPEESRPYYVKLRRLQEFLVQQLGSHGLCDLSMGMSNDYEIAIEEGATWVRIGQAILGPRPA